MPPQEHIFWIEEVWAPSMKVEKIGVRPHLSLICSHSLSVRFAILNSFFGHRDCGILGGAALTESHQDILAQILPCGAKLSEGKTLLTSRYTGDVGHIWVAPTDILSSTK